MKLRDLSYLLALSKTLHFGKAAELVHVSQPTLSVQIKKLEDCLGLVLVERNNKHVRLTPEGLAIAQKAELILYDIESIKVFAETLKDPFTADLHLGIIPTLAPYLLPGIIPSLHAKFPKVSIWLHEERTHILLEQLKNGELDLAILSAPIQDDALSQIPLFTEPFMLALNSSHPLAKRKSANLSDLADEPLLLLTEGHCFHDQVKGLCARMQADLVGFRATSLETLRCMVAENMGLTIMPKLATKLQVPGLVYIPFENPVPSRALVLVYRKTHVRSTLFKHLSEVIIASIPS